MNKKEEKQIQKTTETLLDLLGITATIEMTSTEDNVDIQLSTEEGGMLIGYHGETLEGLQLVLSLCVARELGRFIRISLEIGDYKKNRTAWLEQLVMQTKEKALLEHVSIPLPELKSWERRIVHVLLQDDNEVISESSGEGRERTLSIRPKN